MRILIVEDEPVSKMAMKRYLEFMGYEVAVASNGKEALEESRERRPDVVVSDWILKDGEDGLYAARELQSTHASNIIMVTAHRLEHVREKAQELRVKIAAFRRKPISLSNLAELVESVAEPKA